MAKSISTVLACPTLIGRDEVLQSLCIVVRQAHHTSGRIALVTGEAGIGKSRLVAELQARVEEADPGPFVLQGNCSEVDRSLPYGPLLDLFTTFLTGGIPASAREVLARIGPDLGRLIPSIKHLIPDHVPSTTIDSEQEKYRLFQALTQFFLGLAATRPLLLIIEDVHWCDDTSLDYFLSLARRIASAPILLVLTFRTDEPHPTLPHFLAMLDRERSVTEYALSRLTASETEAMLRAIVGQDVPVRRGIIGAIYAQTEGNPFFIEEIVKSESAGGDLQIPRSVQDAVQRRFSRLTPPAQDLLQIAAVAGRRVDFALLHEFAGQDEERLLLMIKELIAEQLIVEESPDRFAFRHVLTQQAVSAMLLARERRTLHRAVADAIERIYPEAPATQDAALAYHFYEAGAWDRALAYSRRVGERALALHAPGAAVDHLTRAIAAAEQLGVTPPAAVYRSRGLAYGILGEFDHARTDHEQAIGLARVEQDIRAEQQSLIDLGYLWAGQDYRQAGAFFQQATDLARTLDEPTVHARSLNRLANWLVNTGNVAEGLQMHEQALGIFTSGDDLQGMAETLDLLGMAHGIGGETIEGVRHYEWAITLFRETGEAPLLSSSLASKAAYASPSMNETTYGPGGTLRDGQQAIAEALALARQTDWPAGEAYAHWIGSAITASHGQFGLALRHGYDALQIAGEIAHQQWMTAARWALGQSFNLLLMPVEAIAHLEAGLPLARRLGSAWWIAHITASLASAYLQASDLPRAEQVLISVLPPDQPPAILPQRRIRMIWGEYALARREPAAALSVAHEMIASAPGQPGDCTIPRIAKLQGEALTALARYDEAAQVLRDAYEAAARQSNPPLLWQIRRSQGRLYRRWKRHADAGTAYAEARSIVARLAATLDDDLLRQRFLDTAMGDMPREKPRSSRRSATTDDGGLTRREREVAAQVSAGKSNREIAEALFVGERTVATHISNILNKLGISSRAQIATWALTHGLNQRGDLS